MFLRWDRFLSPDEKIIGLALTVCTLLSTLFANYSQNREERLNFLLCLRGDLLIRDLHDVNSQLAMTADTDALTGIANRHAFDRKLPQIWADMIGRGSEISVILIDVDHFKRLNDTYGHIYGDKVLKRLAHLIHEGTRGKADFVARFGGEEFIMLLPEANQETALLVAERLRYLIECAGLPALDDSAGSLRNVKATVSCGIASAYAREIQDPFTLLNLADKGLYRAKAQGRNMVCRGDELTSDLSMS